MQGSTNYKTVGKKKITSAIVMINANGDILAVHPTGAKSRKCYSFPKGLVENHETDFDAALREFEEETGIHISNPHTIKGINNLGFIDCGIYSYTDDKDIHIFLYQTEWFPDLNKMKCMSFFKKDDIEMPEINEYRIITKSERHLFNHPTQNTFKIIDKYNERQNDKLY